MKHVLALVLACSLVHVARADDGMVSQADTKALVAFFDKLSTIVTTDQDHCDKMATEVSAHIDANKALLDKAKAAKAAGKKVPDDVRTHIMDAMKKMAPGIQKCGDNAKVKAAFEKIKQS